MHLKQKGNTFSICLNGILSKNNSRYQISFGNWWIMIYDLFLNSIHC